MAKGSRIPNTFTPSRPWSAGMRAVASLAWMGIFSLRERRRHWPK